jgi:hypothetical protein
MIGASATPLAWAEPPKTQWLVMAHLDGRGGLGQAVDAYERQLRAACGRHRLCVALQVFADSTTSPLAARRALLRPGKPRLIERVTPDNRPGEALADFVSWASAAQPAEHYALLVMGHGAGLLAGPSVAPPGALRPLALRSGLAQVCPKLGQPMDVVCLDTCYGASLEVLYGLRGLCRYATAAPGLVYSPGLDWAGALSDLAARPAATSLVRGLVCRGMSRRDDGLALVGVDLDQMGSVCDRTRALAEALQAHLADEMPSLTWGRAQSRSWGDRTELVDVKALASCLQEGAATPEVREAAAELVSALNALIVAAWESDGGAGPGALGVYFPPTLAGVPPEYRSDYEFASACGWAALLEIYWARVTQSLTATMP